MENFRKEILFVFDSAEPMYAKEAELVNEEFIAETNTYNIKIGGFGGWDYLNNSQFGSMWITNGNENKKIKKIDTIPLGGIKVEN